MVTVSVERQRRVADIARRIGDVADELVRTASRAEISAWNGDVRALSKASEMLGSLYAQYHELYHQLLVADLGTVQAADLTAL